MAGSKDKGNKLIIKAVETLRSTPNEMHRHHRLNTSGTGAHRNRKRYRRRLKHQRNDGDE